MTLEAKHLLRLLKESRDGGAASMSCRGKALTAAHELEELKLAEWHGNRWGDHYYYITDAGYATPLTW